MGLLDVPSRLDPDMRAAVAKQREIARTTGLTAAPGDMAAQRALYNADRAYWNEGGPMMADRRDHRVRAPAGHDIPIRIHYPSDARPAPALIYLHGGGWIVGGLDTHDRIMRVLAAESGWAVVGVDYRLAPETRFPGPLEDCIAVTEWVLAEGADLGLNPARLALGGDSAGGNMSLATLLAMRARGEGAAFAAGLLYYGSYGLRDSRSRRLWGGDEDGLSAADLAFFRECLFEDPSTGLHDPRFDLLRNDLSGLPPLFVLEVAMDPLADDSATLAAALAEAGTACEHTVYDGVLHGFLHMGRSVAKAARALSQGAAFLRSHG